MKNSEASTKLGEFIKITKPDTEYNRRLVNGMILAKSLLTNEEPVYFGPTLFDKDGS